MSQEHSTSENTGITSIQKQTLIQENVLIIGAGPCGLAAAIALQEQGFHPLVVDKGNVVHTLSRYPTHQTFFSSAEKLEIGGVPFTIEQRKPNRAQALAYYREVAKRKKVRVQPYVEILSVTRSGGLFHVHGRNLDQQNVYYEAKYVIIATGYYDNPNLMGIPGEELNKVFHYFHEAHPFYDQHVVVVGGKNSAVDAALELEKVGAHVTVLYRGETYSPSVKPWILPEFESLVRHGKVQMEFQAVLKEIREKEVIYEVEGETKRIYNDFVFAMTGYHPDHAFLQKLGVGTDLETGRPEFNPETMETNVPNVFIAGVIAAGNNANEIFIENGRFHGEAIAAEILKREG